MKKKKILWGILIVFVAIQFIRPTRNTASGPQTASLEHRYPVPPGVQRILEKSCYDCHSNNTRYPWYSNVQPVGWWLQHHVNEGKRELNFDEFGTYTRRRQGRKMEEAAGQVEHGGMPLPSYTWIHTDSKLNPAERAEFTEWANATARLAADSVANP